MQNFDHVCNLQERTVTSRPDAIKQQGFSMEHKKAVSDSSRRRDFYYCRVHLCEQAEMKKIVREKNPT